MKKIYQLAIMSFVALSVAGLMMLTTGASSRPELLTIDTLYNIDTVARVSTGKDSTRTRLDDSSKAYFVRKFSGEGWIVVHQRRTGGDSAQFQVTIGEKASVSGVAYSTFKSFDRTYAGTINTSKFQTYQVRWDSRKDSIKAYFNVSGEKGTDAEKPGYAVTVLLIGVKKNI